MRVPIALAFALLLGAAGGAAAQPALSVPEPSPKASVSQTVGLTG